MHLIRIFVQIDDFCKEFEPLVKGNLLTSGSEKRDRKFNLSLSEVMTIAVYYHESGYKMFKHYYQKYVLEHLQGDFHNLVSYNRFIELRAKAMPALVAFAKLNAMRGCTGISYVDSFAIKACHIKRSYSHKVMKGLAQKGKTSVGWFYGLKLHLVINHKGEIVTFYITPGNIADNNEKVLLRLTKKLYGKLFGDRGYLVNEKLFRKLYSNGVQLVTRIRKNMKNKLMPMMDKLFLRKRGTIESVGGILKETYSLEHTRHRSATGAICHIAATIIAYNFREKKPSILSTTAFIELFA